MPERDPRLSECPVCPPWVECVHFDEQVLWLGDMHTPQPELEKFGHRAAEGWQVSGPGVPFPCSCAAGHLVMVSDGVEYHSLTEARTELARRAELLRLEEPARG